VIDTHCHLGDAAFADDRDAVVVRMHQAGVARALVVESDLERIATTEAWVRTHPGLAFTTGCHPHDASRWSPAVREALAVRWAGPGCPAVGEIGLDYHYEHSPRDTQRRVFADQLALACEAGLPVVIHAREADDDVAAILADAPGATVVLHSFSSGPVLRDAGLSAGWYFSFSGMVSFKTWRDQDTVRAVPAERLLVETDAPYLAPVPHRGKRNEPAFLPATIAAIAAIRGESPGAVADATTRNALRLFWPNAVP
jgi:TatD DNase family protein